MAKRQGLQRLLGERIRQLRKARDWTQEEFAEQAGLDWKYLGAVERGERNLSLDNIAKIASGFGIEVYQLFLFSAEAEPSEEMLTEERIRDLLQNSEAGKKNLMWRILREVARGE